MPADRLFHPKLGHSRKIALLTDGEFRVWAQYILSSDDFGVMRFSAVTLQADNDALNARPQRIVQRAFARLVAVGLLHDFEHQGRAYVYQHDWQDWQKIEYPRATIEPVPTETALGTCTEITRELFGKHPGGVRLKKPKASESNTEGVPKVSQMYPEGDPNDLEKSATTRAGGPAKRLTANGIRLSSLEGVQGKPFAKEPPMNLMLRRFKVWRWMVDEFVAVLGERAPAFELDAWLHELDQRDNDLVLPTQTWTWLRGEFAAEVKRRGLPIAGESSTSTDESFANDVHAQLKREGVL